MKVNKSNYVRLLSVCLVSAAAVSVWQLMDMLPAQDVTALNPNARWTVQAPSGVPGAAPPAIAGWPVPTALSPMGGRGFAVDAGPQASQKLKEALDRLRTDESDESAMEVLTDVLGKLFDADLDQREKKIEELEQQIDDLKAQVAKRREAKERLIKLRIEVMRNESEGLGFPSAWTRFPAVAPPNVTYGPVLGQNYSSPGTRYYQDYQVPVRPDQPQPPPAQPAIESQSDRPVRGRR